MVRPGLAEGTTRLKTWDPKTQPRKVAEPGLSSTQGQRPGLRVRTEVGGGAAQGRAGGWGWGQGGGGPPEARWERGAEAR